MTMRPKLHNGKDSKYCRPVRANHSRRLPNRIAGPSSETAIFSPRICTHLDLSVRDERAKKADTNTSIETPFLNEQCFIHHRIELRPNRSSC